MELLTLQGVTKRFQKHPVLKGITFHVNKGEVLGLLGPNGSGKTTTIRLLNGVIRPDSGSLSVAGLDPYRDGDAIRRLSGIVTETAGFYGHMTALENLRFFGQLYGVGGNARALQLLDELGLGAHRDRKVGGFSTGMKKRLGLAKALLHKPQILYLDEPTNGLDPEGIQQVLAEIERLNRTEGITIVVCSHLLEQLQTVCHRYVFMADGRVLEQGTAAQLEQKYLGDTLVQVETNLEWQGDRYQGVPARRVAPGRVEFTLPSRAAVPGFLRTLLQEAEVYQVLSANQDLQTLYFKVREAARHE